MSVVAPPISEFLSSNIEALSSQVEVSLPFVGCLSLTSYLLNHSFLLDSRHSLSSTSIVFSLFSINNYQELAAAISSSSLPIIGPKIWNSKHDSSAAGTPITGSFGSDGTWCLGVYFCCFVNCYYN